MAVQICPACGYPTMAAAVCAACRPLVLLNSEQSVGVKGSIGAPEFPRRVFDGEVAQAS